MARPKKNFRVGEDYKKEGKRFKNYLKDFGFGTILIEAKIQDGKIVHWRILKENRSFKGEKLINNNL